MSALRLSRYVSIIIFAASLFLVGCSNELNYEVASLTDEQRVEVWHRLPVGQSQKFDDWLNRHTMNGKGIPRGVTVREAIAEQTIWLAMQEKERTKADEKGIKLQAEREAKQQAFGKILSVVLMSKKNEVLTNERKVVALDIAYDNKTDKDIRGVKGVLELADMNGEVVIDIDWSYEDGVSAKHVVVEHGAMIPIDKSTESEAKLWGTDFNKLKCSFEVHSVIFKDGRIMDNPE